MSDDSSRILIDRSVIRKEGRPFFSFGPRVLLTPEERFAPVLQEIAAAGFTIVGTPPCSPGTIRLIGAFLDAAERAGLMAILVADPRLPEHGRYLSDFRQHPALHSYMLAPHPATREGLESYLRERDSIRTRDLYRPIFAPIKREHFQPGWFSALDIYAPDTEPAQLASGRITHQRPGEATRLLMTHLRKPNARPMIHADVRLTIADEERAIGAFSDDPWVARSSSRSLEWFPQLANLPKLSRRDLLPPDPEILRLQVYDILGAGSRGALLHFHEATGGPLPCSGRDRFCEAALLAQEIAVFSDFFAEGHPEPLDIETGHPRLRAQALRHGVEYLIVLRIEGYEEDYFVDEAWMERTELEIRLPPDQDLRAWRVDFPEPRQLEAVQETSGTKRFLAGPLELVGLVLLTSGPARAGELGRAMRGRLQRVASLALELLEVRFAKAAYIEGELLALGAGVDNRERLRAVQTALEEATARYNAMDYAEAYTGARRAVRLVRQLVKYQMAKALGSAVYEGSEMHAHLRGCYYTLPRFYREAASEAARAYTDLT